MTGPTTKLDPRFSDPEAAPTDWPTTCAALEAAQISWLSTVRSDGRPHVTPLVSVWLDDAAYFCTGPAEQKTVNLSDNPHVVLTTGCNTWDRGLDVSVEGEARRVIDPALLERLAKAWRGKWEGQWQFEVREGAFHHDDGGQAYVYEVRPRKVLAFAKGTFSHTSHSFDA